MKIQIRKGVFETNSSSTHAICITKNGIDKNQLPDHISFKYGEFGWEFAVYDDTSTKASYLYQAVLDCFSGDKREEKLNIIKTLLADYDISCNFEIKKSEYDWQNGYIDHGYDTIDFVNAVLSDGEKLIKYLFGDSFVVTGNDNGDEFSDYMYGETDGYLYSTSYKSEFDNYEIYEKGN